MGNRFPTGIRFSMIALAMALAFAAPARAQDAAKYPDHPVTFVVGFAAGGAVDIVARSIGAKLQMLIGEPVVIENRPGANSNVAAIYVAHAKADGYTLLVGANGMTANMALYPNPGFDVEKDFTPVASLGEAPPVLASGKGFSGADLRDLVAQAKAHPGEMAYGSPGAGSSAHLTMELFQRVAGIKLVHVPYRGGAPAISDAVGGHIPLLAVNLPEVLGQVASGDLKILGVPSLRRHPLLPNAPTVAEQGFPGFEASTWWGLFAPAGTPKAIVDKLNAAVNQALGDDEFRARLLQAGGVAKTSTPEEMAKFIVAERAKWTKIILEAGIKAE